MNLQERRLVRQEIHDTYDRVYLLEEEADLAAGAGDWERYANLSAELKQCRRQIARLRDELRSDLDTPR